MPARVGVGVVLRLKEDYQGQESSGKAEMVFICENCGLLLNALCQCHFVNFATPPEDLLKALNAITGWSLTLPELLSYGERSWHLKRLAFLLKRSLRPWDWTSSERDFILENKEEKRWN